MIVLGVPSAIYSFVYAYTKLLEQQASADRKHISQAYCNDMVSLFNALKDRPSCRRQCPTQRRTERTNQSPLAGQPNIQNAKSYSTKVIAFIELFRKLPRLVDKS